MKVIECTNVTKKYGRINVLDKMTFSIEENKMTGLIGRNGAGKTTLLKILSGFIRETSGEVQVFSEGPFNSLFVSANSIFIDDQMTFPPALNLAEILEEASRFYENWDAELAQGMFDYFSFNPHQYHRNLSKGLMSTFNMIIGLSARCALTIFDEPTTGMDASVRKDFYRALLKDYIAHPRSIIISSHHLNEVEDLLEDLLLIKDGKAHLHLPISELKEWAIALQGKKSTVAGWTMGREVLHEKQMGPSSIYSVVKNDFTEADIQSARLDGLEITSVSSSDVCVYLTSKHKGGIDDVFNRNESI
ncbi:ATP-binding cassette domain-containing protein [Lederbergia citrea]|uniref:ATP-binding cassette domain-containing protein n=1 Tax=Lederbergia citrea TaxID=2833581 RepID=UPI001BC969D0|nr:ABC transporter ATP-binding protein [Lederbergia citrea]MBS4205692.1 ABC transporter ATP-binding protein [Lederbergia citrea]